MVNIDAVYQTVQALANKEQRGYLTPQEFNLFAAHAQLEIYEQYFFDLNQARKSDGNDTRYADIDDILEDKMQLFHTSVSNLSDTTTVLDPGGVNTTTTVIQTGLYGATYNTISNAVILPDNFYRMIRVYADNNGVECEILNAKDFNEAGGFTNSMPLINPSSSQPIANISGNNLRVHNGSFVEPAIVEYYRTPAKPNWTYVVIGSKAMYNANSSTVDFELHVSEGPQLVNKILRLAGISIKQIDITQAGQGMDTITTQQQLKN